MPETIYIVGAGPGDPDLITVKGRQLLESADYIFYTHSLIPSQMLQYCREDSVRVPTGDKTLEEITTLMITAARSGRKVVRLHDGDPSLYGAIHEQMELLSIAEVPFEIIPGISAYQLAAARLGVELTVPSLVQTIILTRISGRTHVPDRESLAKLAAHQASLCLYLSARHIERAQAQLQEHYPPTTPVAICYRLGWPEEKVLLTCLQEMATVSRQAEFIRTTLYLISPALSTYPHLRSRLYHPEHLHLFRSGS